MELKYQVYINGSFSELATASLLGFIIEDNSGLQLDSLELSLNNSRGELEIPSSNAIVELAIGYGEDIYKMGKFVVQYIEAESNIINLKAISQDLQKGRIKQNRVFKNKSLADILKTIAVDLSLTLQLDEKLKNKQISYYLQENKTGLEVLAELAEIFYAVANIKDSNLVFISKENDKSISVSEEDILSIAKVDSNQKIYQGVKLCQWSLDIGEIKEYKMGSQPYVQLSAVENSLVNSYVQSKYKEVLEGGKLKISLKGNPNVQAGFILPRQLFNNQYGAFDGNYRIEKATHIYNGVSYITNIEATKLNN